jgi:6-pyruvoyltetrahydropterin/6-carboxytetrahydropterin synthase
MVYVTRRERFNAAHRLFRKDWDDKMNMEIFGKCSNPNWHGHNYEIFVTVKGKVSDETGFVVNLKDLSKILKKRIIEKVDHKNLNLEVDFLNGMIISSENLAKAFWHEIEHDIKLLGVQLHCVKITETENNYIEYFGE